MFVWVTLFFVGLILYHLLITLLGGGVIRLMFGGNHIRLDDTSTIAFAYAEAYSAAKAKDPNLSDNIKLYVCNVNFPEAYAFGRNTILVSESATQLSKNQMRTMFLCKFAQISNNDSERIQLLIAGNFVFVLLIFLIKIIVYILVAVIGIGLFIARGLLNLIINRGFFRQMGGLVTLSAYFNVCRVLSNAIETVLLFVLNLFIRIVLLSAQHNYFINDRFVCECGFQDDLRNYLQNVAPNITGFQSTLGTITGAKPSRLARISRINGYTKTSQTPNIFVENNANETIEGNSGFRVISRQTHRQEPTPEERPANVGFHVVSSNDN